MNCWEYFYMQVPQQQNLLIEEQKTNELKPLYALANIMKHVTQLDKHSVRTVQAQQQHQYTGSPS